MKLKIERTVGETWESYDMDGTYEEVLALVTELGFCKKPPPIYNYHITNNVNPELDSKIKEAIKQPYATGGTIKPREMV